MYSSCSREFSVSTAQTSPDSGTGRMSGRAWGVLFVLCGAIFLEGIDVAMFNVALPAIREDLGLSTSTLQWVMSSYVLGYGGFMLFGGRAADLFGRRQVFVLWLAIFLLFSGLGGFATEGWMLLVARFVTGIAAAFMTPAGLSIINTSFEEGAQRNKALLVYSGTAAGGFSIGLVIGGLLTTISWRMVFFAPVVLSAIILVLALALIPKSEKPQRNGEPLDVGGALSVTAGILLLVFAVERAPHVSIAWTVGSVAVALLLFAIFVGIERKSRSPLVSMSLFREGSLVRSNLTALLFSGGFFGFQFLVVLYLQDLRDWSTMQTSLAMVVIGIDAILSPTLTPKLVEKFGNGKIVFGGLVLAAISYAIFLNVGADWSYALMLPSLILLGLAFSMAYGPLTIAGTEGVAEEDQGVAGGLLYTSLQFGAALGLSAATGVLVATTDGASSTLSDYRTAFIVPVVFAAAGAVISLFGVRNKPTAEAAPVEPAATTNEPEAALR
ncbi:MFS transporter [Streptomyces sp. BI20]|uniref:MFS transporter n=1 Tax=Streptomyces sp. BI20 TaxID=3403460 RepID=UPI003C74C89D